MCLPCGHHLHVTCGLKWLQENNSCPCCRAEVGVKPKKQLKLTNEVIGVLIQERLNTTPFNLFLQECEKIRVLSIAEMLAEAIYRISNEESVSSLYMD